MKEILSLLPKPSRYIGIEEGGAKITKEDVKNASMHMAFAFPDMYEVGMSYLGQKILYGQVNAKANYLAERVFSPCAEAGEILKAHNVPLATLESDTNLIDVDVLGFALTHELAFTNILYMLDLAHIPLTFEERGNDLETYPLVYVGGGCTICAEPITPFVDFMMLGEGEEMVLPMLELLEEAKANKWTKKEFLEKARFIKGIYIPSFFEEKDGELIPLYDDYKEVKRALVTELDTAFYPTEQASPFGAIHNRLVLEIARGCTRSCRFCQAGFTMRPSRERTIDNIKEVLEEAIEKTGYEDVGFLSLSAGDFSALKTLFLDVSKQCAQEQISLSLPSLRVGSVDGDIMKAIANIRRTGATLAPEAGSQRLRDVINKGITEEALIEHVRQLIFNGWQQVKLYFMLGLPGETYEDLDAIIDLAKKVRDCAIYYDENNRRHGAQIQVTISVSPFVPKTHTPFQWEEQISLEEMKKRVFYLRDMAKQEKNVKMRWHEPATSFLEGILSRADRKMSKVVLNAYKKGAIFVSWMDHFNLDYWLQAMEEEGFNIDEYTGSRELNAALPWDHLNTGITKEFLLRERKRAFEGKITLDCRYENCSVCGVCDLPNKPSSLRTSENEAQIKTDLNFKERDQEAMDVPKNTVIQKMPEKQVHDKNNPPKISAHLVERVVRYKVWHKKVGAAAYLSQLEIQPLLERALRRANIPMSFSQGFHPLPLLSFGRALPVGVESNAEWFALSLRQPMNQQDFLNALSPYMLQGMEIIDLEVLPLYGTVEQATREVFKIKLPEEYTEEAKEVFAKFVEQNAAIFEKLNKKNKVVEKDLRKMLKDYKWFNDELIYTLDYEDDYLSPKTFAEAIFTGKNLKSGQEGLSFLDIETFKISVTKLSQID